MRSQRVLAAILATACRSATPVRPDTPGQENPNDAGKKAGEAQEKQVDWNALFKIHYENRVRSFREQNLVFQNVVLLGDSITEAFEVTRLLPGPSHAQPGYRGRRDRQRAAVRRPPRRAPSAGCLGVRLRRDRRLPDDRRQRPQRQPERRHDGGGLSRDPPADPRTGRPPCGSTSSRCCRAAGPSPRTMRRSRNSTAASSAWPRNSATSTWTCTRCSSTSRASSRRVHRRRPPPDRAGLRGLRAEIEKTMGWRPTGK